MQNKAFEVLGYSEEETEARFKQLLDAFEYGTPPHGGIAAGIERLIMVLLNVESIREVIAFPKTQTGVDPLFDAPDAVDDDQLRDLRIMLTE